MVAANPIRIRQIDADRRCRITIASQHGYGDHFGTHPFYLFLLEAFVDRRMIFKPLRIIADNLRALGRILIDKVYGRLPAGFHTQRITVSFDKTVHEIHIRSRILYPKDGVGIECLQVTGLIVFNQFFDDCFLRIVFGKRNGLLQLAHNLFDSSRIKTSDFPYLLDNLSVLLHQPAIESVRDRSDGVFTRFHSGIIIFHLFLGNTAAIVVIGRCQDQIPVAALHSTFCQYSRIKDHRRDFCNKLLQSLSFTQRKFRDIHLLQAALKEFRGKAGNKLILCIMVMDAA